MNMTRFNHRKIRNYLIDTKFQMKFVTILVCTNIFIALMILVSMYLFFINSSSLFGVLQYMHNDSSINFRAELNYFLIILGCLTVLFLILISLIALVLSHRIAGPIYRFKLICDKISEGNLNERIHLRPKDDFQDAASSFNKMMDQIVNKK